MILSSPSEAGLAARYGYPGDRYAGPNEYACQDRVIRKEGRTAWQHMLKHGVAHRTLPCGTKLLVCRQDSQRCTYVFVVDRGPWGAVDKRGHWRRRTFRSIQTGESWRGILDILPTPAKELGIRGVHSVSAWVVTPKQPVPAHMTAHTVRQPARQAPSPVTRHAHNSLLSQSTSPLQSSISFTIQPFILSRFILGSQKKFWPSIDNLV